MRRWLALVSLFACACGTSSQPSIEDSLLGTFDAGSDAHVDSGTVRTDAQSQDGAAPTPPPSALICLGGHYNAVAELHDDVWGLRLSPATHLRWDDGLTKTLDEALEAPDLEDIFRSIYPTGTIKAVSDPDADPGRFRVPALFDHAFGQDEAAVVANLVDVDFLGAKLKFHKSAAPALSRVSTKLAALIQSTPALSKYLKGDLGGTYLRRNIANTTRISAHSYGIAIDIVVRYSNYWEWEKNSAGKFTWTNQIPQSIVDAFESEGFAWGGRWYHYDTMHFEYRPELFDSNCR